MYSVSNSTTGKYFSVASISMDTLEFYPQTQGLEQIINPCDYSWGRKEPYDNHSPPQRSNALRVRNMSRFNGGKLPGNSKHFFKKSKDKAVPGKRSFKLWVSVEKFLFVYMWLYHLILCFVTVFLAKVSYELCSIFALNWYRFSRHWQLDVT